MDDSECKVAVEWWDKNQQFWSVVRQHWQQVLEKNPTITLKWKVDDKLLHEHFMALWKDWKGTKMSDDQLDSKVDEVMARFM